MFFELLLKHFICLKSLSQHKKNNFENLSIQLLPKIETYFKILHLMHKFNNYLFVCLHMCTRLHIFGCFIYPLFKYFKIFFHSNHSSTNVLFLWYKVILIFYSLKKNKKIVIWQFYFKTNLISIQLFNRNMNKRWYFASNDRW